MGRYDGRASLRLLHNDGRALCGSREARESRLAEIEQIRFAKSAKLRLGESDGDETGLDAPSESYVLDVAKRENRWVFSFRDAKGRSGSLVLALPKTISIFEVDPRGEDTDKGLGPSLYKEWKMTAPAAGDGLFRPVLTRRHRLTLVLHGRGNACTSHEQFSHWTLLVHGPARNLALYGALASAE